MSGQESELILSAVDESRRAFIKKMMGLAFTAPVIASFTLDSVALAADSSLANQTLPNQFDPDRLVQRIKRKIEQFFGNQFPFP